MTRHVGIGLRQPHYEALLAAPPALDFVEVHSENFYADGGAVIGVLEAARAHWPVSLHGVGLALGSAVGVDAEHLRRLVALARRIDAVRVSDHASCARAPRRGGGAVIHGSDLLPLAYTPAALDILVANVQHVQEALGRTILVENISAYLHWGDDDIAEPAFFNELTRRSGCGLLLDVNNLVVNALNDGAGDDDEAAARACAWVDAIDAASVGEIHLAGYQDCGDIVIDDHGSRVHDPVWRVYRHALRRLGPRPTLIEWDTALPALDVLLGEAARAAAEIAAEAASAQEGAPRTGRGRE
ncbi:MAG: DUF692 domain-containing protein [Burkholderiales bacterium]|nr:DUF692 domain-containing protein [Burkholderiales bacterium]